MNRLQELFTSAEKAVYKLCGVQWDILKEESKEMNTKVTICADCTNRKIQPDGSSVCLASPKNLTKINFVTGERYTHHPCGWINWEGKCDKFEGTTTFKLLHEYATHPIGDTVDVQ